MRTKTKLIIFIEQGEPGEQKYSAGFQCEPRSPHCE